MAEPPRIGNPAGFIRGKWPFFAVLALFALAAYYGLPEETTEDLGCVTMTGQVEVRGTSMSPLISAGQNLSLMYGYYGCNAVGKGDIVVYNYSGHPAPIVKVAKGVEGDSFRLENSTEGCGWNILINGDALENSQGVTYCTDDSGYRMLSMYERDYNGVIPENACLLLGDMAGGSLDSTQFGFVDRSDLLGKAVE